MDIKLGSIVEMKKPHPCGNNQFLITRIGIDFKIKCCKCNHEVMVPRVKVEKNINRIISSVEE